MPVVSEAQRRAMYSAAEGNSTLGIPQSVGKEFIGASHGVKNLPARVGDKKKKTGGLNYAGMVAEANKYR